MIAAAAETVRADACVEPRKDEADDATTHGVKHLHPFSIELIEQFPHFDLDPVTHKGWGKQQVNE